MIKAKVVKLQPLPDKDEKVMYVKSGDIFQGSFKDWPKVGESFVLWRGMGIELRTTEVKEIIGDREFKTLNSIYKIVTDRDETIELILQ